MVSYVQNQTNSQAREIIVDNDRVNLMILNYKSQTGNLPNKQQLDAIIDNYIKEEISYREAKKMGLDKDDEIIRRRLSQKFDFLQTDLTEINKPSDDDLKQFYTSNPSLFKNEPTVSFTHIYFSINNSNDSITKQRALQLLKQLKNSDLKYAPEMGDRFPLLYDYTNQSLIDIQQNFGDKPMLKELFKAPLNVWIGPFQSGYGWHLFYVSKINIETLIPFDLIKEEVKKQYLTAEKAKQNKKIYDSLEEKYNINREYLQTK